MDIFELREFCLSLPATEETTPFDETTLVYKVAGKMFLLTDMTDSRWINVKCDPTGPWNYGRLTKKSRPDGT